MHDRQLSRPFALPGADRKVWDSLHSSAPGIVGGLLPWGWQRLLKAVDIPWREDFGLKVEEVEQM